MTVAIYEPKGAAREYAPLAVNLYRGCTHRCRYCYCPGILRMTRDAFHSEVVPRRGVLDQLERDCRVLVRDLNPIPRVHLCFTCDPWPVGPRRSTTEDALVIMGRYGIPISTLTKGGRGAWSDLYLLKKMDAEVGVSLVWTDDRKRAEWEPGAVSVHERLEYLAEAKAHGIRTWASVEPVIEPSEALAAIEALIPVADVIKVGRWNHSAEANRVDWRAFAVEVSARINAAGKTYVLKRGLAELVETAQ